MRGDRSDDETLLRERIAELEIARTELNATITARSAQIHGDATTPEGSSAREIGALPRITLDGSAAAAPTPDARSDLEILSTLGEGGMGRVHLARQRSLDRDVAVKTLKVDASPAVAHALFREARITGTLEHPGVIPVHALGVDDDGRPMLVMKRVSGVDLSTQLGGAPCSGEELVATIEVLTQVCRTLEFAHSRGIIHRDVKPENIMVGAFGEVYLLDWGIATSADDAGTGGPIVGTLVYMAPEMALGERVDARTDVYLLGATLHEVLTGRPRHAGHTIVEVMRSAMISTPFEYGEAVPEELARLCNRATAKDPAQRPANARVMREALAAFIRHRSARALSDAALERLAALEELLASAEGPPSDLAHAYRLVTEARFGLTQSLREHADGTAAKEGMRRCLVAAIDLELRQDHVETAAVLARELDAPHPELAQRIEGRRAAMEARERERARLEHLDRELDPTEQATKRVVPMIAVAGVLAVVAGVAASLASRGRDPSTEVTVIGGAVGVVMLLGVVIARRRGMLTNAFNRRLSGIFVLAVVSGLVNRAGGILGGVAPEASLATDLFVGAAILFATSVTLLRRLWPGGLVLLVGHGAARIWPSETPLIFAVSVSAAVLVSALVLATARRQTATTSRRRPS